MPSVNTAKNPPDELLQRVIDALQPVGVEAVNCRAARGRVLAEAVRADRDSPPLDVSSMDGFAVRAAEVMAGPVPVAGEVLIGHEPGTLAAGTALRIFTGSCVPAGADAVVPVEDVTETAGHIQLKEGVGKVVAGQSIRRRGENLRAGEVALQPGPQVSAATAAALAAFGITQVRVHRPVRLGLIVTGDELQAPGSVPPPWQIRDSNGPFFEHFFQQFPWLQITSMHQVRDDRAALVSTMRQLLADCDAVVVSGGASVGDHDYLHAALADVHAREVFSKLPIRPGKPTTAAVTPDAKLIFGLPGNPVAVAVTARRFALPALRKLAGFTHDEPPVYVHVDHAGNETLHLWWYRPVRLNAAGQFEVLPNRGSGDLVAAGRADGFIEVAPGDTAAGLKRFWSWSAC